MKELCLVHLARAHNGIEPFMNFLDSYRENRGGIDHDFLVVFKGFERQEDAEAYRKLLAPLPHLSLEISDEGLDISAYFKAVERHSGQYRYFCFLNSFSVIQDPEWLKKLHDHIVRPSVGLAGATGSWQSHVRSMKNVPVLARFVLDAHRAHHNIAKGWKSGVIFSIVAIRLVGSIIGQKFGRQDYRRFPNYHVRTNAFMIAGSLMLEIGCNPIRSKEDAYRYESGIDGLSMQVIGRGLRLLVVGRNGMGYEMHEWDRSNTFCQDDQANLLVADNQTRQYQLANPEKRKDLAYLAWGR